MNQTEVRRYLNVIKRAVSFIEGMLDDDGGLMEQMVQNIPSESAPVMKVEPVTMQVSPASTSFKTNPQVRQAEQLRQKHVKDLMDIDCWPEAVPPFLATSEVTDEDKEARAKMVLDMLIDRDIEEKRFLDFGCGEGWITKELLNRGVVEAVGYDIASDAHWDQPFFTDNWNRIGRHHFDFVILYDVIDHCLDPIDVMNKIKSCLKPNGTVYVRCHPWTSRHAMHLYKQGLNKAYIHLFLTWAEIVGLTNEDPMVTRIEKDPLVAYSWWFRDFAIEKQRLIKEPVSDFFHNPAFKDLLKEEQRVENIDKFLELMEIQFCDYQLQLR
jgi:2-polyprenyl-3-methyl-5-hydroxy-6-metoxy-1,4-benzoquinol methylase